METYDKIHRKDREDPIEKDVRAELDDALHKLGESS